MQTILWGPCSDPVLTAAHAQCGFLSVPLDYQNPSGAKIQLAVSRVQHTSPAAQYQGVMLTNPGGPGASGLQLATLGEFVPNGVGAQYDWIGFDPRGVGSSKPALSCMPDYFAGDRPPYVPTKPAILRKWLARSKAYADACEANAPELLPHMKTTDSARDMDSIRLALGAAQINYYGFSYGTYLGQVYATLFPTHVRRMVLDSNVDPRRVWYQANLDQAAAIERNIKIWFGWLAKYDDVYHLGKSESAVERLFYRQVASVTRTPAAGVIGPDEFEDAFYGAAYTQSLWTILGGIFSSWVHEHDAGGLIAAYEAFDGPGRRQRVRRVQRGGVHGRAVAAAMEHLGARLPAVVSDRALRDMEHRLVRRAVPLLGGRRGHTSQRERRPRVGPAHRRDPRRRDALRRQPGSAQAVPELEPRRRARRHDPRRHAVRQRLRRRAHRRLPRNRRVASSQARPSRRRQVRATSATGSRRVQASRRQRLAPG